VNKIELKSLLADGTLGTPTGQVVRLLSERGALSAAQIARLTGLAKSTVSATLSDLRRSGVVVETAEADPARTGGAGRPATMLSLNPEAGTCVGVLIGLREIQVIVADVSHAIIASHTEVMDEDYSPAEATDVIRALVRRAYREHALSTSGLLGVGVAIAGPVNPRDGRIQRASVVPTWAGTDVREVFGPIFERPIIIDNESNCAALAEMMWGAAQGHEDFVLFKIDMGVGGAIVHGGRVLTGIAGGGGEFGHMTIDPTGPLCRCGNRGCLEMTASFKPFLRMAQTRFRRPLTTEDVIAMARDGDVGCRRLITDCAEAAGHGLGIIGTIINPPLVVVTGRLVHAGDMLMEPLRQSFEKHTLVKNDDVPPDSRTRFVPGKFVENDSVLGAVGLVLRHHAYPSP
jgi:predicted NBD/HSP70 family sugar kinase